MTGDGMEPALVELGAQDDLLPCIAVMRLLRPHLDADDDIVAAQVKQQMAQGYRLLGLHRNARIVALAGFRFQENLLFGPFLYVDDLVVTNGERRQGHAERLLDAMRDIAVAAGRHNVILDTGLANEQAQRLYHCCGYETIAYRLIQRLPH